MAGQAIGPAVLTAVLAAAPVSAPLMLPSAEQATWEQERERLTEPDLGTTPSSTTFSPMHRSSPGRMATLGDLDTALGCPRRRWSGSPPGGCSST